MRQHPQATEGLCGPWAGARGYMRKQALTSDTGWNWGGSLSVDPSAHPRPSPWVWQESWVQNSWSAPPPSHQTRWTLRTTGDAWRNHTWSLGTGECAGPGAPSAAHRGLVQKALPPPPCGPASTALAHTASSRD